MAVNSEVSIDAHRWARRALRFGLMAAGCALAPGVEHAAAQNIVPPILRPAPGNAPRYTARLEGRTLRIIGNHESAAVALRLRAGAPDTLEVDVDNNGSANFTVSRSQFEYIQVEAGAGDDTVLIDEVNGAFTDTERTAIDGGYGNDTLVGGSGSEKLLGGLGNDLIDGNGGADFVFMGAGDDTFAWDPGDGSDVVEGQDGTDALLFSGSSADEIFEAAANGARLRFTRSVGSVVLDLDGIELLALDALGGADTVLVNELTPTALTDLAVELGDQNGAADAATDLVSVAGSPDADTFDIFRDGPAVVIERADLQVSVFGHEPADLIRIAGFGGDLVAANGSDESDTMTVTANGTFARVDVTGFSAAVEVSGALTLTLNGHAGDDTMSAIGNLAAIIPVRFDGGDGDDTLRGTNGADVLIGGDGNDFIDGQQGADTAFGGAGDDTFQWDPGDGSDILEGQEGADHLLFNGSNAAEIIDVSANGARLRFTRNIGAIVMDVDGVETVTYNALGGADIVNVNELSPTAVTTISTDFAAIGGLADAQADVVNIVGTPAADTFEVAADGDFVAVESLGVRTRTRGVESLDRIAITGLGGDLVNVNGSDDPDTLTVTANGTLARVDATGFSIGVDVSGALTLALNGHAGDDIISATGNLAAIVPIRFNGGDDDDTLLGSNGADVLVGDYGNDFIDGQQGADTAFGGAGDDTFQWDPGDGSDILEGQSGHDVLRFNGSAAAEIFDFSRNGSRLRFTRNIGTVVMDLADIEQFDLHALGGADIATLNDLTGAAVGQINIRLAGTIGGSTGDAQPDSVVVNGTSGADNVVVSSGIAGVVVTGLSAALNIATAEAALDRLTINGLDGDDIVHATGLAAGVIGLTLNGGLGDDQLAGSHGDDLLDGGDDHDTLIGGGGADQVFGQAGDDRLVWNPGDGTDLNEGGPGNDTVEVRGSDGAESFTVTANGTRVRFDRLSPAAFFLDIGTCEDLLLLANGGDDSLACTGNLAALIRITADGGPGADTLLGSNGNDRLLGGDDDDFIDGQQGADVAFLGAGNDTFQWDPGDGSDTVEGEDGADALLFNGSNIGELIAAAPNGTRVRFTRNIGSVVMDLEGVELLTYSALGGPDAVQVDDLTETAVAQFSINLAATGGVGDAQPDSVTLNGTPSADAYAVSAAGGTVVVDGPGPQVRIGGAELANDDLVINGLGGTDTLNLGPNVEALIGVIFHQ